MKVMLETTTDVVPIVCRHELSYAKEQRTACPDL